MRRPVPHRSLNTLDQRGHHWKGFPARLRGWDNRLLSGVTRDAGYKATLVLRGHVSDVLFVQTKDLGSEFVSWAFMSSSLKRNT